MPVLVVLSTSIVVAEEEIKRLLYSDLQPAKLSENLNGNAISNIIGNAGKKKKKKKRKDH